MCSIQLQRSSIQSVSQDARRQEKEGGVQVSFLACLSGRAFSSWSSAFWGISLREAEEPPPPLIRKNKKELWDFQTKITLALYCCLCLTSSMAPSHVRRNFNEFNVHWASSESWDRGHHSQATFPAMKLEGKRDGEMFSWDATGNCIKKDLLMILELIQVFYYLLPSRLDMNWLCLHLGRD